MTANLDHNCIAKPNSRSRTRAIAYWTTTLLIAAVFLSGGMAQVFGQHDAMEGMVRLGYPVYFVHMLGFWKVLGGIAILLPRSPLLKEWAYAGIVFELTGAAATHIANGSAGWHVAVTLSFAAVAIVSWALRPNDRMLEPHLVPRIFA
jgi:uncharacterized membrane protein YphA (DoxX/SURF4 family)